MNKEKTYTQCRACGMTTPLKNHYCEFCGAPLEGPLSLRDRVKGKSFIYSKQIKRIITIIIAVFVVFVVGYNVTKITIPELEGMSVQDAEQLLEDEGFKDNEIIIKCDKKKLKDYEIIKGDYIVIEQSVAEGSRIHASETITLTVKDAKKERIETINELRYKKYKKALDVEEALGYSFDFINIAGEIVNSKLIAEKDAELSDYYVYEIIEINDEDREAILAVDTKDKIVSDITKRFKACIDKSVDTSDELAKLLDFDITYLDYDGKSTYSKDGYVVTGVKEVDFYNKIVIINSDSEQHIKDLEILPTLVNKLPYVGLDERYIDDTAVGEHDYVSTESGRTVYTWESNDGKYDVLEVGCSSGVVSAVNKLNKDVYWKSAMPDFAADKDAYDQKVAAAKAQQETMVWISQYGSCYHSNQYCSNMKSPWQVTLSQAKNAGRRACSKCY